MITIDYFSDVLCVWAYGGQIRLDELQREFAADVKVRHHFIPLFADTATRIGEGWKEQGGFAGFGKHMQEVCEQWEHTRLSPLAWTECRPASCTTSHVFLKAVGMQMGLDDDATDGVMHRAFERLITEVREMFFEQGMDISEIAVLLELLEQKNEIRVDADEVRALIDNGRAYAGLQRDQELAKNYGVLGSPTYVFNEGRQLLYGNVGYRIIESNMRELLAARPVEGVPSWC